MACGFSSIKAIKARWDSLNQFSYSINLAILESIKGLKPDHAKRKNIMMQIELSNDDKTVFIKYDSTNKLYSIFASENPNYTVSLDESELDELKGMIESIIQYVNKRDY